MWESTNRPGNIDAGERCARCGRVTTARVAPGPRCNRCVADAIAAVAPAREGWLRERTVRRKFSRTPGYGLLA